MGKLHTIGNAQVRVYARDHRPAHFHVVTPNAEAMFDIATLELLRGSLPATLRRMIDAWAAAHRALLVAEWNRINPDLPL